MTHIFLIRHGEYIEDLADGKYCDLGLSPKGIEQSNLLRDRLAKSGEITPDVFISSPQKRAFQTAEILSSAIGKAILTDNDIEEWRSSDGSLSPEEFNERWKQVSMEQQAYYRWIEGYENRSEFSLRVNLALNKIISEHAGKTVLLLTHGAFIQLSFNFFFGYGEAVLNRAAPEITNTSITHWYKNDEKSRWILERSNDRHHLFGN